MKFGDKIDELVIALRKASSSRLADRFWRAFEDSVGREQLASPQVFPGGTDGQCMRMRGVPVIGFSPIRRTEPLLHSHDEYLGVQEFIEGICGYEGVWTLRQITI